MTTLRTRASKGLELTHSELDANFVRDVKPKTTTYACLVSDNRSVIECSHATTAFTVTLGDAATMAAAETGEYEVTIININAAVVTVARAGSDTINGVATSLTLNQWDSVTLKVNNAENGYNVVSKGFDVKEDWTAVTFEGTWVDLGGSYSPTGFYKDLFGRVHIRGAAKDGSLAGTVFTLPAGYRPAYLERHITTGSSGYCEIDTDGTFTFSTSGSATGIYIDGISFRAA